MWKPQKKTQLAIVNSDPGGYVINFSTDDIIAREFEDFGRVIDMGAYYRLEVDRRYDFKEVYEYVRSKGE